MSCGVMPSREAVLAVDHHRGLEPLVLLIAAHIDQLGQGAHLLQHTRSPGVELGQVVPLERVLIEGGAHPSADAQVLHRLEIRRRARHLGELSAQPGNHLPGAGLPFLERFQGDEHAGRVRRGAAASAAAGEAGHVVHVGVCSDNVHHLRQLLLHGLKRDILLRLNGAADPPGVLLREETFGNDDEEDDIDRQS